MDNINQEDRIELEEDSRKAAKKLQPKWKNPPTVDKLKQDLIQAKPDFDQHISDVQKWLDIRDGKLKVKTQKGQSKIVPKLVRKQNEWRYASLSEPFLASEDMFDVEPQTYKDENSARDNALIINKQFEKDIDRIAFIDEYVRTAVDEGTVFVRVGWEYEEELVKYKQPIKKMMLPPEVEQQAMELQQQMNMLAQAVQMGQADPAQAQQQAQQMQAQMQQLQSQAFEVDTDEFEEVEEVKVVKNRPTLEICDYDRVMLDPTCGGDMEKAQFIIYRFTSSKAELREDPKYTNVDMIVFDEEDNILDMSDEDVINETFKFRDEPRKKLTVTEYWGEWDIHGDGTTVPIVAAFVGSVMIRLEENPFPDRKPPFVKVNYLPKRRDVYGGEPDAVLIEDHQDIIGAITRGMIDLMGKSANAQQGISANALDPAQRLRFEQGKDFIFNPDVDPSKAFYMATYPDIPQSAMNMIEMHTRDAEEMTSIVPFSAAKQPGLNSTASAVRSATDATAKREMGIIRRLSNGIVEIGKKILAMNQLNLSDEEVIRITDGEWVTIKRENLAGDFDLRLSVSTPEADQEQAQDLGFMLQTIGPNMDPGLQAIILGKIARLKKMPGLAQRIETYQPQPDPMEQKVKELQAALLEAQVANERAKGTENEADTQLKTAKAQTEMAKARALESSADMTDLNFVHEKNGVKERRQAELEAVRNGLKKEFDDHQTINDIDKQVVGSALDPNNPLAGGSVQEQKNAGMNENDKLKPKVFNANNHYQKTPENVLPVIDEPQESLMDGMIPRPSGE